MILFCKFDAHLGSCSVQIDEAPSSVCLQSDWPNLECHSDSDTHWGLHETSKRGLHWAIEHENSWKWIRAPKNFALLDYIMIYQILWDGHSSIKMEFYGIVMSKDAKDSAWCDDHTPNIARVYAVRCNGCARDAGSSGPSVKRRLLGVSCLRKLA